MAILAEAVALFLFAVLAVLAIPTVFVDLVVLATLAVLAIPTVPTLENPSEVDLHLRATHCTFV
jgi:hypothetical protein